MQCTKLNEKKAPQNKILYVRIYKENLSKNVVQMPQTHFFLLETEFASFPLRYLKWQIKMHVSHNHMKAKKKMKYAALGLVFATCIDEFYMVSSHSCACKLSLQNSCQFSAERSNLTEVLDFSLKLPSLPKFLLVLKFGFFFPLNFLSINSKRMLKSHRRNPKYANDFLRLKFFFS